MKKFIILFLALSGLSSCASYQYSNTSEQRENTSFVLVTNFPNATVEVVTKKNKTLRMLAPHQPGTTRKQYTIGRLKPSGNYIRIGGADYEPIVQKIKVTPRSKAVTNDLLLGVFTYFTPFLVDPFRSDFYKIKRESKEIVVHLEYNQYYMYRRFEEIAKSNSPEVFQTYITTYPKSNLAPRAKDKIDSLDLHQSMLAGSEEALDVFIKSHPGSRFSKIAQSQKEKMAEARVQYSLLANSKDLASFKNYILNFPNFKQTPLAVAQALNVAVGTKSLEQLLAYDYEILIPYQSVLSGVDRERLTNLLNAEVDKAIVREKSNPTDNFKSYTNIWNFSQELSKEYSNLNYLQQCRSYGAKIADLFLAEMGKAKTEIEQTKLMSKYSGAVVNFDYLGPTENFFVSCLHRTNSYTGSFKLMNQGFLTNYLAHSAEGDNLKNFYELTQGNLEEINLSNGQIIGFKMFANDSPIATYEKQPDGTLKYARYSRGGLIKEEFYNYSKGINYTYDYENGKNKSLQDLDSKVSNAETVLKSGNYQEARRLLTTVCKNNYPKSVSQNVKITDLIAECDKQEQIAREFEMSLLSGNYDGELKKSADAIIGIAMILGESGAKSQLKKEISRIESEVVRRTLTSKEVQYFDKYLSVKLEEMSLLLDMYNALAGVNNSTRSSTQTNTSRSSSESNSDKEDCTSCRGTGKCSYCDKTFKFRYWKGGQHSTGGWWGGWDDAIETKPGWIKCTSCQGYGLNWDYEYGRGPSSKKCYTNCNGGWKTCNECYSSSNGGGKCRNCNGSGKRKK